MKAPGVGCGVVLVRDGTILLIRRRRAPEAGCWSLVGGKVDFLEAAAEAGRRECREECSIEIHDLRLLGVSEQAMPDEGQHWVSLIFLAERFSGDPQLLEPEKHSEFGWFAPDALPSPLARAVVDAVEFLEASRRSIAR